MLVSHVASLSFYVVFLLSNPVCSSALCLLYLSKSVFRKSLQEVWTGQEGTPWVASQPSTTLVPTSTHHLLHPPIEFYPELLVVTKVTSAQLFTQPSSPATWSLPWATPPRVFIAGYIGAPEWQCHLNFTSYCWQRCWVSQDQPKLKLAWVHSLGVVLHWILLSVTEIEPPPPKLRKTLTHRKPVKIVIVIEHQGGGLTILNAT